MELKDKNHSEEVDEILTSVPNWMIRWGITFIFFLIVMLLFISWMVKYPEVIEGQARITTETPPVKLTAMVNGRIQDVLVENGDTVSEGQVIAVLENPLDAESVGFLRFLLDTVELHYKYDSLGPFSFGQTFPNLGDIQTTVNEFRNVGEDYFNKKYNTYDTELIKNLKKQIVHHEHMSHVLMIQLNRGNEEMQNATENIQSDQQLYEKGVISKMEYFEERSKFVQKQQALENIKTQLIQNNISLTNLEKQLIELKFEQDESIRKIQVRLTTLMDQIENQISGWQQTYLLRAAHSGTVNYLAAISKSQAVSAGDPLFAVIPVTTNIIGYVEVPSRGIGRVKVGQKVRIDLSNFPSQEFGQVNAEVITISEVPRTDLATSQSFYFAKLKFPDGLKTSYNKELKSRGEMIGTASIITDDLRVLERVFNQFRTLFDN